MSVQDAIATVYRKLSARGFTQSTGTDVSEWIPEADVSIRAVLQRVHDRNHASASMRRDVLLVARDNNALLPSDPRLAKEMSDYAFTYTLIDASGKPTLARKFSFEDALP
jgi:hypothetical protein